jgi:TolB-like protein
MPGGELVREEVERIAASPVFLRSERLVRFLRYVVEQTLAGNGDSLKEFTIGVSVHDRPDFDPRLDSAVRVDARRLRAKLEEYYKGPGSQDPLRIDLPKGGYIPVFQPAVPVACAPSPPVLRRRPRLWALGLALLVGAAAFIWFKRAVIPTAGTPANHSIHSLAVLPFANMTGRQEDDALCDGIAEEMIDRLARVRGVRIVSRTSSFAYKGKAVDVRTVARELKVDSILQGSLRASGGTMRVTIQLIRGADGSHVWSEPFDFGSGDNLQMQAALARIVERRLAGNLPADFPAQRAPEEDRAARNLTQQAVVLLERRTPESLAMALEYARQAAQARPSYAPAHAAIADASLSLADFQRGEAAREDVNTAQRHARKAIELDPSLPGPFAILGMIELHINWDWGAAGDLLRRALATDPNHAEANARQALLLSLTARHDEARRHAKQADALAPTSVRILATTGELSYFARRFDDAIRELRKALAIDPGYATAYITITRALELSGRSAEAVDQAGAMPRRSQDSPEYAALRAWLDARHSNPAGARAWMKKAAGASCVSLAGAWAALGEPTRALEALQQGVRGRDPAVVYIKVSPSVDPLRQDTRLEDLCKQVGLTGCLY